MTYRKVHQGVRDERDRFRICEIGPSLRDYDRVGVSAAPLQPGLHLEVDYQ